jgi:thiol-disulfide isomerase/thioredoxin
MTCPNPCASRPAFVMRRRRVLEAAVSALGLLSAAMPGMAAPLAEVALGQTLPEAGMKGLNGPDRKLSDYRGTRLLINVWASWCGPCRQEMASLERLAWQEQTPRFAVIGISTDDDTDKAAALLRQSRATISHFIDRELQLESLLGASRLPLTVLVDASGVVVERIYGAQVWDGPESKALIAKAFRRPAATRRR